MSGSCNVKLSYRWLALLLGVATLFAAGRAEAVPSFARQTGMACSACHTVIPELTPEGREFKLNGYTTDNLRQVSAETMKGNSTMALTALAPISMMLQVSFTHTGSPVPDSAQTGALAKDGDLLFPQQASFFYAGKIADGLGAFIQLTYDGAADHFGFDNTDIRYVHYLSTAESGSGSSSGSSGSGNLLTRWLQGHDVLWGVTANNNPTVQDPWNTTQAWGFPYSGSSVAPTPSASTRLDTNGIGQTAAGAGMYLWIDHSIYLELSGYTSAETGGAHPSDSTDSQVLRGLSPYWRLAYERRWGTDSQQSLMIGTYGMQASVLPGNGQPLSGPSDRYTDVAGDVQYQYITDNHQVTLLGTYIHEDQNLAASFADTLAANRTDSLRTLKLTAEYSYRRTIGGAAGFFETTGSNDTLLYPMNGTIAGSATGSPDSRGYIAELDYLPMLNVKLQLQYVGYTRFNGGVADYAGIGRSAAGNNTLYALAWFNF